MVRRERVAVVTSTNREIAQNVLVKDLVKIYIVAFLGM